MPGEQSIENGKLGGRPKGRKNDLTLEKEKVDLAIKQRIMQNADKILNAQLSVGTGQTFLYKIITRIDDKGKKTKERPILVTDEKEISDYLDGEYGWGESLDTETEFYYLTTKEPQNIAIDSMFNRALGKPTEKVDIGSSGKGLNIILVKFINKKEDGNTDSRGVQETV